MTATPERGVPVIADVTTALRTIEAMRTDMIAALEAELGPRRWHDSQSSTPVHIRGDGGRMAIGPVNQQITGTYPYERWHEVAAVVARVGLSYGFTDVQVLSERAPDGDHPAGLDVQGVDEHGSRWMLSMSVNTVLMVRTGMLPVHA